MCYNGFAMKKATSRFVAYYRVSTKKQAAGGVGGASLLDQMNSGSLKRNGLDAQRAAVLEYLDGGQWELLGEFVEAESGKLGLEGRPQLKAALAAAKGAGATLLIAKLDRLARNVAFIANLMEAGVPFVACDMPTATEFQLHIFAAVAQLERKNISSRVKSGMQAAKAKGRTFGTPANLAQVTDERTKAAKAFAFNLQGLLTGMKLRGMLQREMVAELNQLGIKTPSGGQTRKASPGAGLWTQTQLQRVVARLAITA